MFKFLIFSLLLPCFCKIIMGLAYRTIQHQDDGVGSVFHHIQDWILDLGDMTKDGCYFISLFNMGESTCHCVFGVFSFCVSVSSQEDQYQCKFLSTTSNHVPYNYVHWHMKGRVNGSI